MPVASSVYPNGRKYTPQGSLYPVIHLAGFSSTTVHNICPKTPLHIYRCKFCARPIQPNADGRAKRKHYDWETQGVFSKLSIWGEDTCGHTICVHGQLTATRYCGAKASRAGLSEHKGTVAESAAQQGGIRLPGKSEVGAGKNLHTVKFCAPLERQAAPRIVNCRSALCAGVPGSHAIRD